MNILSTVLYIVIFVVCLSVLIVIHELGHLLAAKAFKVYCFEYSIGFGPKIFSFKRKNGETKYSLRGIPFGGYVSMYGEGVEVPDGLDIPFERNLEGIKKWKKSIILLAGVTMNAVLALVIFFLTNLCFPTTNYYLDPITINETNALVDKTFKSGDSVDVDYIELVGEEDSTYYYLASSNVIVSYSDSTFVNDVSALLSPQINNANNMDWSYFLHFASLEQTEAPSETNKNVGKYKIIKSYEPANNITDYNFSLSLKHYLNDDEEGNRQYSDPVVVNTTLQCLHENENNTLSKLGIEISKQNVYLGVQSFKQTFIDFGNSSTAIIRAFGSLFTSQEARDSMGGIIAIGFETTSILQNFGVSSFLRVWGMVSVNLAIVNLLPFPGLDGWQLLVLIVEGISKKKMPDKVKNIVSIVGLVLLFGLMILLVFKDIFKYIIH